MRVVGVVLDLGERQKLRAGGSVAGRLPEIYFSWRLGEGDGVVEGRVGAGVGHPEPGGGLEHA